MSKKVIQGHHLIYKSDKQDEVVVKMYKGEHWVITQLQRRKKISKGIIKALKHWIILNEDKAIDLNEKGGE